MTEQASQWQIRFMVVDYRRSLLGAVPDPYIGAMAGDADLACAYVEHLAGKLKERLPPPQVSAQDLPECRGPGAVVRSPVSRLPDAGPRDRLPPSPGAAGQRHRSVDGGEEGRGDVQRSVLLRGPPVRVVCTLSDMRFPISYPHVN